MDEYKNIDGFDDYKISSSGSVFSSKCGRILKPRKRNGYYVVSLYNVQGKTIAIHRLVALHFIPNPFNKPYVNHKDGNKLNNAKGNLEWSTAKENTSHSISIGLQKKGLGQNRYDARKKVINISTGQTFDSIDLAAKSIKANCSHLGRKLNGKKNNNTDFKFLTQKM